MNRTQTGNCSLSEVNVLNIAYKLFAILPVPLVAPLVPDLSDAVPLILFDEQAKNNIADNASNVVLSVGLIFMVISLVILKLHIWKAKPLQLCTDFLHDYNRHDRICSRRMDFPEKSK